MRWPSVATPKRNPKERGYGWPHQQKRAQYAARLRSGEVFVCAKCGNAVRDGMLWDLGHTNDRSAYTGPEHRRCNRSDGATRSNRKRAKTYNPNNIQGVQQRDW